MSDLFELAFDLTMEYEGGGKPHEVQGDRGGLTCWGVSIAHHRELFGPNREPPTKDQAMEMYRSHYWNNVGCNMIQVSGLAVILFDAAVNCGQNRAIRWLQSALAKPGVVIDGIIGPATIGAVNDPSREAHDLVRDFTTYRIQYYQGLGSEQKRRFFNGWCRRSVSIAMKSMLIE
ncbi:MAG: hypothetical protein KAG66_09340 [Methylococcales bacterium]|nr:hypothetical protein [Methylococcales bacterium]